MARLSPEEGFEILKGRVAKTVDGLFPIVGKKHTLELEDVEIKDNLHIDDIRSQKKAKIGNRTWAVPVEARIALKDNTTGKKIDVQKVRLMSLPKHTRRYSHIIDGQEYQIDNQWRLKQGIYARVKDNGELASDFNVKKGRGFKIGFDPKSRQFKMQYGTSNIPLRPLMREMGVSQEEIDQRWGKQISGENQEDPEKALAKFYKASTGEKAPSIEVAREHLWDTLNTSELREDTTKKTVGRPHKNVTGAALMDAATKLLHVSQGKAEPDARDALPFKELHSAEDFFAERIDKSGRDILRRVGNTIDRRRKVSEIIGPDTFNRPIREMYTLSGLANIPDQTNPLEMISGQMKTTITGEGGIKNAHGISEEAKLIDPSHLGFLDPIHTPEGKSTGVSLRLPVGVKKDGHDVKVTMYNLKTGRNERVNAEKAMSQPFVLPDQVRWEKGKPVAADKTVKIAGEGNEIVEGKLGDAKYVMRDPMQLYSMASNLVPFIAADHPNRSTMAGRHMEQAIPLVNREAPLVQSLAGNKTFENLVGRFSAHQSHVDGQIAQIKKDAIVVKDKAGKRHEVHIYDNFPLNADKGFIHSTPLVKVGDTVKKGQTVADSNFTKNGDLALGTNLRTGYMPYKGYNYEDGVVISESAAKKLSSEHLHRNTLSRDKDHILDKKKFQAYSPDVLTRTQADKLDDDGVAKPGQMVMPGDTLIAALRKKEDRAEDRELGRLHKSLVKPYVDASVKWEADHPGIVEEVVKRGKKTAVHVKTVEAAEVGDKIAGRHGNKGIIVRVLPDEEMPHTKDGKPLQLLLNPIGVPGRVNLGQNLETAAAKIAEKTGKPYRIKNFTPGTDLHAKVSEELKAHGLEDKEEVFDPETKRPLGRALVGPHNVIKLKHQVEKKMRARAGGAGYAYDRNLIPKGGGPHGAQALGTLGLYSMLAHGAQENLREMQTVKSDAAQNDEFWAALQAGEPLPAPRPTFAYKKFTSYLNALGVNAKKDGNNLQLVPFTDQQVAEMSSGAIKDGGKMVRGKDLKAEKGGLFDPRVTGGVDGTKWSHLRLPEPFPNPVFEKAIQSLTGMTAPQFKSVMDGTKGVDPKTGKLVDPEKGVVGGKAFDSMLGKIDIKTELQKAKKELANPNLKGNRLDRTNKKIKYLTALKNAGMTANDAYMMRNVPVMPPSMRPVSSLPDGTLNVDDLNHMYKGISLSAKQLKDFSKLAPDEEKNEVRAEVYDGLKALTGLGGHLNKEFRGVIDILSGKRPERGKTGRKVGSPKEGFFQKKLVQRKQDLSMRSTIVPEPALGLDEVGVPRAAALEVYKPFVTRELRNLTGATPLQAQEMINQGGPMVNRALDRVVDDRPLLLKRDPVLHKYGIQSFKPRIVGGKAVQIHPLVTSGFNADFNGDSCSPATLLVFSIDGEYAFESFWELSQRLLPGSSIEDQLELAAGGTAILQLDPGLKVLSRIPGKGVRWVDVHEFTIHTSHGPAFDVQTHIGRSVNVSEHHNFAVVDDDLICRKTKTEDLRPGQLIPFIRKFDVDVVDKYEIIAGRDVALDWENGWFFGYFAGDGSVTGRCDTVSLACGDDEKHSLLAKAFERLGFSWWDEPKMSVRSTDKLFARYMLQFGHGAPNKTVPSFVFGAPKEFREGFVAGLLDAEGNVGVDVNGALHVRMEVASYSLIEGLSWLLLSLGIGCYFRKGKEPTARTHRTYVLEVSRDDLGRLPMFKFEDKAEVLRGGLGLPRCVERSRYDLVPFCAYLAELFVARGRHKMTNRVPGPYKSKEIRKYGSLGYMTRRAARRVVEKYGPVLDDVYRRWVALVEDASVGWTLIEKVVETERPEIMYDFSVPDGDETFAVSGGLITRNTMAAFVPIGRSAVEEARKMHPSRNLFSPSTGDLMYTPTLETQLGLYGITKTGKKTRKSYKDIKEVQSAIRKGEVSLNDQVKVGGLSGTPGRFMVAGALPEDMRKDFLKSDAPLDGKKQKALLAKVAKKHRNSYGEVVNQLKDLGNQWSTDTAFSLGLEDLAPEKRVRDQILAKADREVKKLTGTEAQKEAKSVQIYAKATEEMHKKLGALDEDRSNLLTMNRAGTKPGTDALRQIKMAPMLIMDAKGNVIPTPVRRSFSEGLDVADYWTNMSGARKGIIQKVQQVSEPGWISKRVMNSVMDNSVVDDDCGTDKGIALSVDEKDILDRQLASDHRAGRKTFKAGTLVTPEVRSSLRNNKVGRVLVRSPLRCQHGPGVCKACYGLTEDGRKPEVGLNVGVLAGQALGERSAQLAMKAFHCNHADSIVFVRAENGHQVLAPTMEDLFEMVEGEVVVEGGEEVKQVEGWRIWDGSWVELTHVRRHKPGRPMVLVSDGHLVTICQDNHPIGVWKNNVVCEACGYHRFKDPHKKKRQYCAKCGHAQDAPDKKIGEGGFLPPAELEKGKYYLRRDIPRDGPGRLEDPDFDPYFVGAFLAEGCVVWKRSHRKQRYKRPYQIQISQEPGGIRDEILRRGESYGPKEKPRYLAIDDVQMGQAFHELFGRYSRHKSLPHDFLSYSAGWLNDVIAGIIDGDGTVLRNTDGPPAIAIDTTSFALAQQIVLICMHNRLRAGIVATTRRKLTRHQGYQVRIGMSESAYSQFCSSLKVRELKKEQNYSSYTAPEMEGFSPVGAVREVLYTHDYVYDATTETGTLYVSGLKSHNTGGTAASKDELVDEFQRVKDLTLFPQTLPRSATLSTMSGKVEKIQRDPAGGYNVFIGGKRHYVPGSRGEPVYGGKILRKGAQVKKGAAISRGPVNPHEMLPLTGVEPVQGYLSGELHKIYGPHGIRRRNTEMVVKSLTNLTKIEDPGDHKSVLRGDYAPTSKVANLNRAAPKGVRPIRHRPILKGVDMLPLDMQEDWVARMNHERIKSTVVEAAQQGWTSKLHGRHPIPPVVYGSEFGKGPKPGEY